MKDRIPTKILANGAIRHGVYDESGTLLRYEYIKPEDEPTEQGTPICKATLLKDATAALFELMDDAVPDDVFNSIKVAVEGKASKIHTHDDRYYTESESLSALTRASMGLASSAVLDDAIKKLFDLGLTVQYGFASYPGSDSWASVPLSGFSSFVHVSLTPKSDRTTASYLSDACCQLSSVSTDGFSWGGSRCLDGVYWLAIGR